MQLKEETLADLQIRYGYLMGKLQSTYCYFEKKHIIDEMSAIMNLLNVKNEISNYTSLISILRNTKKHSKQ